jgi:hypothetical protein
VWFGESVWVVHRSWPPPRQARWGAGAGWARGVRCGGSVCVVHRSWPPPRQARAACRCWRGAGSAGCSPPSLPRWKLGSVHYRAPAPAPLPAELASVEAWICPLQGPCARPAPHRACLGGSADLSTTEPLRLPLLPTELASVEAGICEQRAGSRRGAGCEVWGEHVGSAPILATTEASSVGCRCWSGAGRTRVGESVCVVRRSWLPPRQARVACWRGG